MRYVLTSALAVFCLGFQVVDWKSLVLPESIWSYSGYDSSNILCVELIPSFALYDRRVIVLNGFVDDNVRLTSILIRGRGFSLYHYSHVGKYQMPPFVSIQNM